MALATVNAKLFTESRLACLSCSLKRYRKLFHSKRDPAGAPRKSAHKKIGLAKSADEKRGQRKSAYKKSGLAKSAHEKSAT